MKAYNLNNINFEKLTKADLYEGDTLVGSKVYACKSNLFLTDFIEYDLKAILDKKDFSNIFTLSYLTDSCKEEIEDGELDILNSTIFPTLSEEDLGKISNDSYFGSITLKDGSGNRLLIIDVPEGITKVVLCQSGVVDEYRGSVVFGPEEFLKSTYSDLQYSRLVDEIKSRKILFIKYGDLGADVFYIQDTWTCSDNSNRNKDLWTVRNDFFESSKNYLDFFDVDNFGYTVDGRSGTVLSRHEKLSEAKTPILEKKRNRAKKNIKDKKYNHIVHYHEGEEAKFANESWFASKIQVSNEIPTLSPSWISSDFITGQYYLKLPIEIVDSDGNIIEGLSLNTPYIAIYGNSEKEYIHTTINDYRFIECVNKSALEGIKIEGLNGNNNVLQISSSSEENLYEVVKKLENPKVILEYREDKNVAIEMDVEIIYNSELLSKDNDIYTKIFGYKLATREEIFSINSMNFALRNKIGIIFCSDPSYTVNKFSLNGRDYKPSEYSSEILQASRNKLQIYLSDTIYRISIYDSYGRFETSYDSSSLIHYKDNFTLNFYISEEFDPDNDPLLDSYVLDSVVIEDEEGNKFTLTESRTSIVDNILKEEDNSDYEIPTFELCEQTHNERPSREVWTLDIKNIVKNYKITLNSKRK